MVIQGFIFLPCHDSLIGLSESSASSPKMGKERIQKIHSLTKNSHLQVIPITSVPIPLARTGYMATYRSKEGLRNAVPD